MRCVQVLARGDPTLELVQIIDKHKCDLTVIGACAHKRPRGLVVMHLGGFDDGNVQIAVFASQLSGYRDTSCTAADDKDLMMSHDSEG